VSQLKVDYLSTRTGTRQDSMGGQAKSWVSYTTVTSTTSRASLNVSSLTDNNTSDTTINYTSAFDSRNYSFLFSGGRQAEAFGLLLHNAVPTASATRAASFNTSGGVQTLTDCSEQHAASFGTLA
jgi:hypothetical protein